jgi:hypothetical protein
VLVMVPWMVEGTPPDGHSATVSPIANARAASPATDATLALVLQ